MYFSAVALPCKTPIQLLKAKILIYPLGKCSDALRKMNTKLCLTSKRQVPCKKSPFGRMFSSECIHPLHIFKNSEYPTVSNFKVASFLQKIPFWQDV